MQPDKVCHDDDEVDALYDQTYRELLLVMIENPRTIQGATYMIWAAHNLERIADLVTNIATCGFYGDGEDGGDEHF